MKVKPSIGVIVGRFQVPELHDGHLELFRTVRSFHDKVAVFIGLSPTRNASRRHPLDFETRRRMIQAKFPEFQVLPLLDRRTDQEWSNKLDEAISQLTEWGDVVLYGSRDSFVPHYHGRYPPKELVLTARASGTEIRESLTNTVKESYDFRAGVIYANQNRRPRVETTVDIAIIHHTGVGDNPYKILLGQKSGFPGFRFIGGYADPRDVSFEAAAHREAFEETGLDLTAVKYVGSAIIPDWRYQKEDDSIKSLLFIGWSMTQGGKADDDISNLRWFDVPEYPLSLRELIVPEHKELFDILAGELNLLRKGQNEPATTDRLV